ncbi:cytochrome c oxidase subunit II [Oleiagrimonas sp. MCCC 1A03011]|uniref:cytochrome c oxidase subunit II n=1 Tax=Oleiagrimonas sp. MCCC 1A03011 TaxID=1926883 RepID=UPI000DC4B8E8|nr:cytochrome c oxidase subunit II [Oleiagrimonas sp. MCCC 1A03011]RAP56955.1 cytochrome c oxidase subunit II [Oleiagrimonas sp. MCCC 1A03011]
MKFGGIRGRATTWAVAASALLSGSAWANPHPWQLNLTKGVTQTSHEVWDLNMASFLVCVVIGVIVFGAMIIAMFRFRKSKGAVAEKWSHSTKLELVWTIVPVLILIGLAWPATKVLVNTTDTADAQMTVKVTGYQWKWRYDYVDYDGKTVKKVGFMSRLDKKSDATRQLDSGLDPKAVVDANGTNDYLLNVDHPLVVPAGVKIRFLITGGDVIHSWWVPDLGWKMDAIPGIVNAAWTKISKPGIYRGQCAELCGQDHGFMPIVVKAVPKAQFEKWLAAQESAAQLDKASRTAQADSTPGDDSQG